MAKIATFVMLYKGFSCLPKFTKKLAGWCEEHKRAAKKDRLEGLF